MKDHFQMKNIISILAAVIIFIGLGGGIATNASANQLLDMDDGTYAIEVTLEGGSGKASVTSPCELNVVDGQGYATLQWSSSYYDYMIVDGQTYYPTNDGGNSTFEIPILVYNEGMPVIADTTAMGTPHEVNYTLTFASDGIMGANETPQARARYSVYIALVIIGICIFVAQMQRLYRVRKTKELARKKRSA